MTREVICADALAWLHERAGMLPAIVTSLPDAAELPAYGSDLTGWAEWFGDAAYACLTAVRPDGICVFYQTDRQHARRWYDKVGLLLHAAERRAGIPLRWHRIVLRATPGHVIMRRPGYAHLAMFSRLCGPGSARSDVIPESPQLYANGMPFLATRAAIEAVVQTGARAVCDPFCGYGTTLAVGEEYGLDVIGVDIDPEMVERSRRQTAVALVQGLARDVS